MRAIHFLVIVFLFLIPINTKGQAPGNPIIKTYSAKEYKASSLNWDVVQDKEGRMYFANNDGILQYDGTHWELIPMPVYVTVRSLAVSNSGIVYIGAVNEFGYLQADSIGKLKFVSLLGKVQPEDRSCGDVWKIKSVGDDIWFSTYYKLFRLHNGEIKVWKSDKKIFGIAVKNKTLYISVSKGGFKKVTKDSLEMMPKGEFFTQNACWDAIPFDENKILLLTYASGLYLYDLDAAESGDTANIIKHLPTEIDTLFLKHKPYVCTRLSDGRIAISVLSGGTVILTKEGKLIRHINKESGLISLTISQIYLDREDNLWIITLDGISKLNVNSPISYWGEEYNMKGIFNDFIRYNNKLYISNYQGAFQIDNYSTKALKGFDTGCFPFLDFQDPSDTSKHLLLLSTNYMGLCEISNNKIGRKIPDQGSVHSLIQSKKHPEYIYAGTTEGLGVSVYKNKNWETLGKVEGITGQVREIFENTNGDLWISDERDKVFQIIPTDDPTKPKQIKEFSTENKKGFGTFINLLEGELIFGNTEGLFRLNQSTGKFFHDSTLIEESQIGTRKIIQIQEDKTGKLWIAGVHNSKFNVLVQNQSGKYEWIETAFNIIPEMNFSNAYFERDSTIWIGGSEGLYRFKGNLKQQHPSFPVLINQITINSDSTLFYGNNSKNKISESSITINYIYNSILFKYSAPSFYDESRTLYQTFLEGFDKGWSEWSNKTEKEYTFLNEGDYTMHIRAKNIFNVISSESTFNFTIKPPWSRTPFAYTLYIIGLGLLIWLIVFLNTKRLKALNVELEHTVKERTTDLHEVNTQLEENQVDLEQKQEEIMMQRDAIENQNKELEKLSIVASETENAISIMDSEGNFLWFNDAYVKLYEYTLEEYKDAKGGNLLKTSSNSNIKDIYDFCLAEKKSVNYESEITTRSGHNVWTQVTITPILDDDDNVIKLISIESDIQRLKEYEKEILTKNEELASQRDSIEQQNKDIAAHRDSIEKYNKELEKHRNHLDQLVKERTNKLELALKKAEESDRLKSAFLANMSHEIRTPMNAIVGFSELITDPDIEQEQKEDLSYRISQNCDSLLRLIDDIIDLAKIEAGQLELERSEFNISDILEELEALYNLKKSTLNKDDIEIIHSKHTNEKDIAINTDKVRVKQVFINLLDNALKFTEKGSIEFGFKTSKKEINFFVKDTGIGISNKQINEIFNRFRKLEGYSKTLYRGAGLGLAISKNIIELLGGKIWVESSPMKGSNFQFSIPLK